MSHLGLGTSFKTRLNCYIVTQPVVCTLALSFRARWPDFRGLSPRPARNFFTKPFLRHHFLRSSAQKHYQQTANTRTGQQSSCVPEGTLERPPGAGTVGM